MILAQEIHDPADCLEGLVAHGSNVVLVFLEIDVEGLVVRPLVSGPGGRHGCSRSGGSLPMFNGQCSILRGDGGHLTSAGQQCPQFVRLLLLQVRVSLETLEHAAQRLYARTLDHRLNRFPQGADRDLNQLAFGDRRILQKHGQQLWPQIVWRDEVIEHFARRLGIAGHRQGRLFIPSSQSQASQITEHMVMPGEMDQDLDILSGRHLQGSTRRKLHHVGGQLRSAELIDHARHSIMPRWRVMIIGHWKSGLPRRARQALSRPVPSPA